MNDLFDIRLDYESFIEYFVQVQTLKMNCTMEILATTLSGIELFQTLKSIWDGYKAVKDCFMVRKIVVFSQKAFDEETITNYMHKIEPGVWQRIEDSVVHTLTQAEDVQKAGYERNLVQALLIHKITEAEFFRMNFVLTHLFVFDIADLRNFVNSKECSEQAKESFAFYRLLDCSRSFVEEDTFISGPVYQLSDFGKKFMEAIGI